MEAAMAMPKPNIEAATTERLLANLKLAIDEAKLVRMIVCASDQVRRLQSEEKHEERVKYLNREITYLEQKLQKVRSLVSE